MVVTLAGRSEYRNGYGLYANGRRKHGAGELLPLIHNPDPCEEVRQVHRALANSGEISS